MFNSIHQWSHLILASWLGGFWLLNQSPYLLHRSILIFFLFFPLSLVLSVSLGNLTISSRLHSLLAYSCLCYCFIVLSFSMSGSGVPAPIFNFDHLSLFLSFLDSLAKCFSVLLNFSKNQVLVSLIFLYYFCILYF